MFESYTDNFFEITDEEGVTYKIQNWTDEEWMAFSIIQSIENDNIKTEELFNV